MQIVFFGHWPVADGNAHKPRGIVSNYIGLFIKNLLWQLSWRPCGFERHIYVSPLHALSISTEQLMREKPSETNPNGKVKFVVVLGGAQCA